MKRWFSVLLAICCMLCCTKPAFAENDWLQEGVQRQLERIGGEHLLENLPDETAALLAELGLEEISFTALLCLSPVEFFQTLGQLALAELRAPIVAFAGVLGVVLLCALLEGVRHLSADPAMRPVFGAVATLCVCAALAPPVVSCIRQGASSIRGCADFLLGLIPVLTGVMIAGGQPLGGATYQLFMFTACQTAAQITANLLIPLLGIYLALGLVASTVPEVQFEALAAWLKKGIIWALGLLLSLFIGLMSVQSLVAGAADGATTKATKYLISNLVPVVGGAVSDAMMATKDCIRMLRSTLGGFGIVTAAAIFLPTLLRASLWYGVSGIAAAVGDLLGVGRVTGLMRTFSSALGMLISLLLSFAVLVITATSITLLVGGGV